VLAAKVVEIERFSAALGAVGAFSSFLFDDWSD